MERVAPILSRPRQIAQRANANKGQARETVKERLEKTMARAGHWRVRASLRDQGV